MIFYDVWDKLSSGKYDGARDQLGKKWNTRDTQIQRRRRLFVSWRICDDFYSDLRRNFFASRIKVLIRRESDKIITVFEIQKKKLRITFNVSRVTGSIVEGQRLFSYRWMCNRRYQKTNIQTKSWTFVWWWTYIIDSGSSVDRHDWDILHDWDTEKELPYSLRKFIENIRKAWSKKVTTDVIRSYSLRYKLINDRISRKSITGTIRRSIVFGHAAESRPWSRSRFTRPDANSYFNYTDEIPFTIEIELYHVKLNDKFKIIEFFTLGFI